MRINFNHVDKYQSAERGSIMYNELTIHLYNSFEIAVVNTKTCCMHVKDIQTI